MGIDEIDISGVPVVKNCPSCGSDDVIIFDSLLKCHKCFRMFSAYEIRDEFGE